MYFATPFFLYFLFLLPLFAGGLILLARYRRQMVSRLTEQNLLPELIPEFSPTLYTIKNTLLMLAFLFAIIALARPQWGFEWQEIKHQGLDIFLVIDTSKSMMATDVKPNRLERTKMEIKDFLKKLKGDRVGLVTFAGDAFLTCPLTADYQGVGLALNGISSDMMPIGGTNMDRALQEALRGYEEVPSRYKAIVVITDGENWEGDPLSWAKVATEKKIRIHTVGVGTTDGELIRVIDGQGNEDFVKDKDGNVIKSRLNEKMLMDIASISGGTYVHASGTEFGLDYLYDHDLSGMEKREVESKVERRAHDRFQWPLALALAFLVLETLLTARRKEELSARFFGCVLVMLLLCFGSPAEASWSFLGDPGAKEVRTGNEFFHQKKYDEALKGYEKALSKALADPRIDYDLGAVYYKKGDYKHAVESFQKSVLMDDPGARLDANYNLGNALYKAGVAEEDRDIHHAIDMLKKALLEYDKTLIGRPKDKEAAENKAFVIKELERLQERQKQQQQNQQQQKQQDQKQKDSQQDQDQQNKEQQNQDQQNKDQQDERDQEKRSPQEQKDPAEEGQKEDAQNQGQSEQDKKNAEDQRKNASLAVEGKMSQDDAKRIIDEFSRNEEPKEMMNFMQRSGREKVPSKNW